MAIAVDGTTPVRWTGTVNAITGGTVTSASFTAPANALLVMCVSYDTNDQTGGNVAATSASDSGGLTWTKRVERQGTETTVGGGSVIFTARTTSAVSRTASAVMADSSPDQVSDFDWGTGRVSAKLYVLTGVDVDGTPVDTVGASNEGGSTTNNLTTTSITPGANGLLVCCDTDWEANGSYEASSDLTQDTANYAGAVSVCSGYKTCPSGVGVTGNLNAAGAAAAQHKWCQVTVREAAAGGTTPKNVFGKMLSGPFGGAI